MRILHIITGLGEGGAEAVLYRLCIHDKENVHIVVSLSRDGKYGELLKAQGIEVNALNLSFGLSSVREAYKLYLLIRKYKADVIQTWMYHANVLGGLVAKLARSERLHWGVHHSVLIKTEIKRSTYFIAKLGAYLSHWLPERIIYCACSSRVAQESLGYNRRKGAVVSNGYNILEFRENRQKRFAFRKEMKVDESEILIGHVGRYDSNKDYRNLLAALSIVAKSHSNATFVLIGRGLDSKNKELVGLVEYYQLEDRVKLEGRRQDIPTVMNGIDLFVLSSKSEAFPNVLNEAMACKTPCVSTNVGDASLILGETGWVVNKENSGALAGGILLALNEKLNDREAWLKRRDDCHQRIAENFSVDAMVEGYKKIWGKT